MDIKEIDKLEVIVSLEVLGHCVEVLGDMYALIKELEDNPDEAKKDWCIECETEGIKEIYDKLDNIYAKRIIFHYEENNIPLPEYLLKYK